MRKIKFNIGNFYHLYNRGTEKRIIFINKADMWRFLQGVYLFNNENSLFNTLFQIERENKGRINFNLLKEFVNKNQENRKPLVRVMADCLMPNHYHLLVQEIQENGISKFMQKLGTGYAGFFNKKYNRVGALFQGRFKFVEIKNDIQLMQVLAYINVMNPGQLIKPNLKEEGIKDSEELKKIMSFARNYSFSTNPDYLGIRDSIIIDKGIYNDFFPTPEKYEKFVKDFLLSKSSNKIDKLTLE